MTTKESQESAYTVALLRSLRYSGVKFLRYFTVDVNNNIRCKVKPVDHLSRKNGTNSTLDSQVSIAEVCYGGLPYYADFMIEGTGLDARNVLKIQPDMKSFRMLPYAPKSALVMGNLLDQYSDDPSPLCTRSLLKKVVQKAAEKHNIAFSVGVEIEFCLVGAQTGQFVDDSVFANTITLNEQEPFLSELYDQLQQQEIQVELIHAESGPGQLEVVLEYSNDPIELADNALLTKETIQAVARQHGFKALFVPKYDLMKAGNGMHVHVSIRDATTGKPIFCDGSTLTPKGSSFVEGLLQHLPALMGLTLPTVNSFRRVGKGCWTGSVVGWALEDKEVGVRVCSNLVTKEWDHVELKLIDNTCNLYLGLAALLSSGLDGITNEAVLRPALADKVGVSEPLPESIEKALEALEKDPIVMGVLGSHLGKAYLALKKHEANRAANMTLEDEVKESLARS